MLTNPTLGRRLSGKMFVNSIKCEHFLCVIYKYLQKKVDIYCLVPIIQDMLSLALEVFVYIINNSL